MVLHSHHISEKLSFHVDFLIDPKNLGGFFHLKNLIKI